MLAPFRALRYAPEAGALAELTSPPYDVIDDAEVAAFEELSPCNVVRLILPRGPESGVDDRYQRAARQLAQWRAEGVLRPDDEPALYVYEMRDGEHVQRGLLGALALVDPDAGIVLPHENTMAGPVSDRLHLTRATEANLSPVFLIYDGGGVASAAVSDVGSHPPLATMDTADGVAHRLWAITDRDVLDAIAADLLTRSAVIADGHHRYQTFRTHQAERHAAGDGPGPWDFGLAFLVDAKAFGPEVHAIHRVVPGLDFMKAHAGAEEAFRITPLTGGLDSALAALRTAGERGPAFVLSDGISSRVLLDDLDGWLADLVPGDHSATWRGLDVTVLHHGLVRHGWMLDDDESTVEYRHDAESAEAAAAASGGTAVLLNPTPVEALIAVASAGERMPRKSTFFTPKPRTGVVIRAYADFSATPAF